MKTLKEWLKGADVDSINLLKQYNLIKLEGEEYVPIFSPLETLKEEDYKVLEKRLKGIVFKDEGNSVVYFRWEERGGKTLVMTRRLKSGES